ncbi:hypothetical protein HDV01_005096 [Terramyces sp. JEL0728]|nr:hypothetical protein HDV01_005096 [Terramyces sp. JEL0728]
MKYSLQVVSTRNGSSRPSFYLSFDSAKYLFNAGEGTQRNCNEHQIKLSKLKAIFLSKIKWDNIGGLPGLIFTIADANVPQIDIVGPKFLTHFIAATRRFMLRSNFNVKLTEIENNNICYQDDLITVYSTTINSNSKHSILKGNATYEQTAKKKRRLIAQIFPSSKDFFYDDSKANLRAQTSNMESAVCYICRGPMIDGKMDAKKARGLGVKNGPDMGKLVKGESVVSTFGTTVTPSQCVSPPQPGSIFMILDCPDNSFIESLTTNGFIKKFLLEKENIPKCIIHQSSSEVLNDARYIDWIKAMNPKIQHIFIADGLHNSEIPFASSSAIINVLNKIDKEVFPQCYTGIDVKFPKDLENLKKSVIGTPKMNLIIEPKVALEPNKERAVDNASSGLMASIQQVKKRLGQLQTVDSQQFTDKYAIPLGTGSAIPGKYRNVSSTLFRCSGHQTILLDCGEGTMGQMHRHFGPERLEKELKDLNLVFISHMHADHHLGLFEILQKRKTLTSNKLYVVGPYPMFDWINDYSEIEDIGMDSVVFIDSKEFLSTQRATTPLFQDCGISTLRTALVKHCHLSYAVALQFTCGFKLSFSGDCRPSDKFAEIGFASDLLVHEATLTDDLHEEAILKNHCTIGEAIQVGIKMQAKHVLLTHFSQRYPKFPESLSIPKDGPVFGIAFDLMLVTIKNFWKLPFYNRLYNQAFGELLDDE